MALDLTINDVCAQLELSERTVYDLCRRGKLPRAAKVSRQWRVGRELLGAWMATGGAASATQAGPRDEEPTS